MVEGIADAATLSWNGTPNTSDGQPFPTGRLGILLFIQLAGSLNKIRLSAVARSADWIQIEYNNQNSPATFYLTSLVAVQFIRG